MFVDRCFKTLSLSVALCDRLRCFLWKERKCKNQKDDKGEQFKTWSPVKRACCPHVSLFPVTHGCYSSQREHRLRHCSTPCDRSLIVNLKGKENNTERQQNPGKISDLWIATRVSLHSLTTVQDPVTQHRSNSYYVKWSQTLRAMLTGWLRQSEN